MRSIKLPTMLAGASLLALLAVGPPASAAAAPPGPAPGVTMSAAAASASTVYLAYTGTNGAVYVRNAAQPAQAATALGRPADRRAPAAVVPAGALSPGRVLAVFGRGTDTAPWWRHHSLRVDKMAVLGGVLHLQPGRSNRYDHPVRRAQRVRRRDRRRDLVPGLAGEHRRPAKVDPARRHLLDTHDSPAARHRARRLERLAAAAATNRHVWLLGRGGMANHLVDYGGRTTANPAVTLAAGAPVVAFARGTDNALWYTVSGYPIGGPGPWHPLGGKLISGVTATTVTGGKTYVLALGTDNQIWMRAGIWPARPLDVAVARPDRKGFLAADGNREPPGNLN